MSPGQLIALSATAALLLAVLAVLLWERGRARRDLSAARAEVAALEARVDRMAVDLDATRSSAATAPARTVTEFLITDAGAAPDAGLEPRKVLSLPVGDDVRASGAVWLGPAVGDRLVKAVAFGYGVRRALSPETRNRIVFAMKREVRRARKQRKRDTKAQRRAAQVGRAQEEAA